MKEVIILFSGVNRKSVFVKWVQFLKCNHNYNHAKVALVGQNKNMVNGWYQQMVE